MIRGARARLRVPARDERGQAVSTLVAVVMAALFLVTGLVVDGGAKVAATREAAAVAAEAARAGVDASADSRASGRTVDVAAARAAAQRVLADRGVSGAVGVEAGVVRVTTTVSARTVFLSAVGMNELTGRGESSASLYR